MIADDVSDIMQTYLARLCWNTAGWQRPTGEARGHEMGKAYVNDTGFGHEEWLFDYSQQLDGYHYGFVEPLRRSKQISAGDTISLLLYAVSPEHERYYVGEIGQCEVLSPEECRRAVEEYERRGWLDIMRDQIAEIGGDVTSLPKDHMERFNLRFRPENAERYDPWRLAEREDRIQKLNRYVLCAAKASDQQAFRRLPHGRQEPLPAQRVQRAGTAPTAYDPAHRNLQNHLLRLLQARYGNHVTLEDGYVDVKVTHPEFSAYIEIKTSTSALKAIREGLGQVLEYAFRAQDRGATLPHCIISSPCPETEESARFLHFIRRVTDLSLRYWQVSLATDSLPNS